jgi:hypothetical protein
MGQIMVLSISYVTYKNKWFDKSNYINTITSPLL